MKKVFLFGVFVFFLISFVSAGVTIDGELNKVYNFGDKIEFSLKVAPEGVFDNLLVLKLHCGTDEVEIYKEYVFTTEEYMKRVVVPVSKSFIGNAKGSCVIDSVVGGVSTAISNPFTISNRIEFNLVSPKGLVEPGQTIYLNGTAYREDGKNVNGFVEATMKNGEGELTATSDVVDGYFSLSFVIPENFKAGDRVITLHAYENDKLGQVMNEGTAIDTISVRQVPKNIEIFLDEKEVEPGSSLKAKILLHDQAGDEISSFAYVAIKNDKGEIVDKLKKKTGVLFEYPINATEAPATWTIGAYSEDVTNKVSFKIKEKKAVKFEVLGQSLLVKNVGNVPYQGVVNVTVGERELPIEINLDVGEEEKYILTAPDGVYDVRVGDVVKRVSLTGHAIDIKKEDGSFNFYFIWGFLIFILALAAFVIYRRSGKKSFFGKVREKKESVEKKVETVKQKSGVLINPNTKTELSLSISGTKQNAVVGCLHLKNYEEIKSGEGNVRESLASIVDYVESKKGLIYKNHGYVYFIFAPVMTKTFKNEHLALDAAKKIVEVLKIHNKKFKQRIDFGVGLNYGTIVTKIEVKDVKFMTLGTLMTILKKIAGASEGEIYMAERVKERLASEIRAESRDIGSMRIYVYKEDLRKKDYSPFLKGFMERQKKEMAKNGGRISPSSASSNPVEKKEVGSENSGEKKESVNGSQGSNQESTENKGLHEDSHAEEFLK